MKKALSRLSQKEWQALAEKRLKAVLRKVAGTPSLRRYGGVARDRRLTCEVRLVGAPAMIRINGKYRGKHDATDVLSFPSPAVFQRMGNLGELVICLPTLKRQARELGHAPELELSVLLAHGVLHLLGLDHEKGGKQAAEMARWEARILPSRLKGLIGRTHEAG